MKKIGPFLLLMGIAFQSHAVMLKSELKMDAEHELQKVLMVQCVAGETFCQELCNEKSLCSIPETICEDCASQSSPLVKMLFTGINSIFKNDSGAIATRQLSAFLKTQKFMTISHDSMLNNTNPEDKEKIKIQFEQLCNGIQTQTPLLISTLNERNHVEQIVGILCQDSTGELHSFALRMNPLYSDKSVRYWDRE